MEKVKLITGLGAKLRGQVVMSYKHEGWGAPRAGSRPLRRKSWCL